MSVACECHACRLRLTLRVAEVLSKAFWKVKLASLVRGSAEDLGGILSCIWLYGQCHFQLGVPLAKGCSQMMNRRTPLTPRAVFGGCVSLVIPDTDRSNASCLLSDRFAALRVARSTWDVLSVLPAPTEKKGKPGRLEERESWLGPSHGRHSWRSEQRERWVSFNLCCSRVGFSIHPDRPTEVQVAPPMMCVRPRRGQCAFCIPPHW